MFRTLSKIFVLALPVACAGPIESCRAEGAIQTFPSGLLLIGTQTEDAPGSCGIRVMSPDGMSQRSIYHRETGSIYPGARLSAQGDRLGVCYISADGHREIQVINPSGRASKVADGGGSITAWSPNGQQLAWYHLEPATGKPKSFIVDVATGKQTRVELPADYVAEDWHPHRDTRIAIYLNPRNLLYREQKGDHYPTRQLDLVNGGETTPITRNPSTDNIWARFSPTGDRIAHYGRRLSGEKSLEYVVVCRADGSEPQVVFEFTRYGDEAGLPWFRPLHPPAWSPDGSTIAWIVHTNTRPVSDGQQWEVVFIPLDGGEVRRVSLTRQRITWVSAIEWH